MSKPANPAHGYDKTGRCTALIAAVLLLRKGGKSCGRFKKICFVNITS